MLMSELISVLYPVDDNTELLHQGLSVEKIVGSDEEIPECHDTICLESLKMNKPGERPEPGKVVHFVHSVSDVDNLSKTL